MVNKTKTVGKALIALTVAMAVVLSLAILPAMAEDNETLPVVADGETALAILAGESAANLSITIEADRMDTPKIKKIKALMETTITATKESGILSFPQGNDTLFAGVGAGYLIWQTDFFYRE